MNQMTQREAFVLAELVASETALYEKLRHYEAASNEQHIRRLCNQLADRSRQHLTALSQTLQEHGASQQTAYSAGTHQASQTSQTHRPQQYPHQGPPQGEWYH